MCGLRLFLVPVACLFFSVSFQANASFTTCPVGDANYSYTNGRGRAEFVKIPKVFGIASQLAFHVTFHTQSGDHDYWFLFDSGNARFIPLVSTTDVRQPDWVPPSPDSNRSRPLVSAPNFYAWSDDMKIMSTPPQIGTPAPEHIFLPGLADTLEFGMPAGKKVVIKAGMFVYKGCADHRVRSRE